MSRWLYSSRLSIIRALGSGTPEQALIACKCQDGKEESATAMDAR